MEEQFNGEHKSFKEGGRFVNKMSRFFKKTKTKKQPAPQQQEPASLTSSWTVIEEHAKAHKLHVLEEGVQEHEFRVRQFLKILSHPVRDIDALRKLSWDGVPQEVRASVWQLLLDYTPADSSRMESVLAAKRKEYEDLVALHYLPETSKLPADNNRRETLQQIRLDVPRTVPQGINQKILNEEVQTVLERILLVWAKENPHLDYFQGLGDIAIHFLLVFLGAYIDVDHYNGESIPAELLWYVEADSFWCVSKIMKGAQLQCRERNLFDLIEEMMKKMGNLVRLVDDDLLEHFEAENVEFIHFSFRWMLCLLSRELHVTGIHRLWDTYLAEGVESFQVFHVYVCAAFLLRWNTELKELDFSDSILFLQHLPTDCWSERDTGELIRKAYTIGQLEKSLQQNCMLYVGCFGGLLLLLCLAYMLSLLLIAVGYDPKKKNKQLK